MDNDLEIIYNFLLKSISTTYNNNQTVRNTIIKSIFNSGNILFTNTKNGNLTEETKTYFKYSDKIYSLEEINGLDVVVINSKRSPDNNMKHIWDLICLLNWYDQNYPKSDKSDKSDNKTKMESFDYIIIFKLIAFGIEDKKVKSIFLQNYLDLIKKEENFTDLIKIHPCKVLKKLLI